MIENEAIKYIQRDIHFISQMIEHDKRFDPKADINRYLKAKTFYETAISALEEIQQYREIGTVEECREAVEKQKPKKPDYEGDGYADGYMVYDTWICPNCGEEYEVDCDDYKYCHNCGQAIDWEDA